MSRDADVPVDEEWATMLSLWSIPAELLAQAPVSPYFFDVGVFAAAADEAIARAEDTVSDRVARDALPPGGTILDVGVGAGAASLRLDASHVTGVDSSGEALDAFVERAGRLRIDAAAFHGSWPAVQSDAPIADVVVCHHVLFNVGELAAFATALDRHARNRVVLEVTAEHPMRWMHPYWKALHDIDQPDRPTVEDIVDVLDALGLEVGREDWQRRYQMIGESGGEQLERIARRLCLPASRRDELAGVLRSTPPPDERAVVTLWWSPRARPAR